MSNTAAENQMILAKNLIKKDYLEMSEIEQDLCRAPQDLVEALAEIERLRELVFSLARNEVSEAGKEIIKIAETI